MIDRIFRTSPGGASVPLPIRTASRPVLSLAMVLATGLLSACLNPPDSVIVGSVPDDYRTNHPIVIAEKAQVIDLPVGTSDRGMTRMQRTALGGFLSDYDRSAAPVLSILVPVGSRNEVAASHAASEFAHFAKKHGVPASRVLLSSYRAGSNEVSAPIRVMYTAMKAQTDRCGRWPADIADTTDNKHYANFGCSYQNNLAAQVADPADLLGPRKMTPPDAERRGIVIDDYREAPTWIDPPVREIEY